VKVALCLAAKNEIEIIQRNIEFHRPRVDLIIVTDNASTDGTSEYLKSVSGPNLQVIYDPDPVYHQEVWSTRMALAAFYSGMDWVIGSDVDMFFPWDIRHAIEQGAFHGATALYYHHYNFVPTAEDDQNIADPLTRMQWRKAWPEQLHNVIHRSCAGKMHVHQGNHGVTMDPPEMYVEAHFHLKPYHYPERSVGQFIAKAIQGGKAYENHPEKTWGIHWRRWFKIYQEEGESGLSRIWNDEIIRPRAELVFDNFMSKGTEHG
jgi:hypothetical protein